MTVSELIAKLQRYLPCVARAFLGAGPNLSLINDKSSHGDIYNFNLKRLDKAMLTTQEF